MELLAFLNSGYPPGNHRLQGMFARKQIHEGSAFVNDLPAMAMLPQQGARIATPGPILADIVLNSIYGFVKVVEWSNLVLREPSKKAARVEGVPLRILARSVMHG